MEKIQRLPRYCETGIGQVVEAIQEWKDPKWDRLVKLFRTVFKRADSVQTYNSQEFLETFKDKMRPDDTDPRMYCCQFATVGGIGKEENLGQLSRVLWFVQDLPPFIRN